MTLSRASQAPRPPSNILLPALACFIVVALLYTDGLWRMDNVIYDAYLRLLPTELPDDIVIIAIDEASIEQIGRWPWPRRIHAELIGRLAASGVRAIGYDVIFAEPDSHDPEGDDALVAAVRASKNVVLPVLAEQAYVGAPVSETLPLPSLSEAAAALGHVHIELDADGIARSTYLYEGLSGAHWPHFALALAQLTQSAPDRPPADAVDSPYIWVRNELRLIPFAGNTGTFPQLSFARVVRGDVDRAALKNKIVLVGVTATGLGDALPTPMSALGRSTPGVEINANLVAAIRAGKLMQPISTHWRYVLSIALVVAPLLLFPLLSPRATLAVTILALIAVLTASYMLLRMSQLWFPPVAILFVLASYYPLWSWRRLEYTLAYLNSELDRLSLEPTLITSRISSSNDAAAFLRQIYGLNALVACDATGQSILRIGDAAHDIAPPRELSGPTVAQTWRRVAPWYWRDHEWAGQRVFVGVRTLDQNEPGPLTTAMIEQSIVPRLTGGSPASKTTIELLQARIEQVQQAGKRITDMRRFVSNSLAQLPDGVIIADQLGTVLLWNRQATALFNATGFDDSNLLHQLAQCAPPQNGNWADLLGKVLATDHPEQVQSVAPAGKDVIVHLSPLTLGAANRFGIIATLSDITDLKNSERRRSELLSFISHDLRAPLVSILSVVELAKQKSAASDDEWLNKVQRYSTQSLELAQGVVDLAQIDSGDRRSFKTVNFVEVAANAADQVWGQAKAKHIGVRQVVAEVALWVDGDAMLLQRAVMNLLTNAIKYSPHGATVEIHVGEHEGVARCCVRDRGFGIPDEDLPHIFERFHRSRHEKHQGESGTGLGLALVQAVASAHGGQVFVTTTLGQGSEFCLTVPTVSLPASAGD